MEENFGNLNIDEDEEIPVHFTEEDVDVVEDYSWCLMRRVLTESVVHFMSMRNTLANLWHPLRGISITNIGDKRVLFRAWRGLLSAPFNNGRSRGGVWVGQFLQSATNKNGADDKSMVARKAK
ncbi:hypothetical protein PVK06_040600 [Gossypium arboreum]|uniref:Uncharacterized protein n=1 Tax=Gossypium arboreum TaxID=29729 RepID=A0ABR0N649_GOSAR|nr:hypothetical protein PVK06_040600 [Gossypium arboreum]